MSASKKFITPFLEEYKEEIEGRLPEFADLHDKLISTPAEVAPGIRRHPNGKIAGSIDLIDAVYLYLFVRVFKPNEIFEIGTWTGMSSLFMAEAIKENGKGHIFTCDCNDHFLLDQSYSPYITRINAMSDEAINMIPPDINFDMVFLDGDIDKKTSQLMNSRLHDRSIILSHDFMFPGEKGVSNAVTVQKNLSRTYRYLFPFLPKNISYSKMFTKTSLILLIPESMFIHNKKFSITEKIWIRVQTFFFFLYVQFGRVFRKTLLIFKKGD